MRFTPYGIFIIILCILLLVLRSRSKLKEMNFLIGAIFISLLGMTFEVIFTSFTIKLLFNQLKFIGVVFIPMATLLLYIKFLKLDRYNSRLSRILLSIIPISVLIVIATNSYHHLFWVNAYINDTSYVSYIFLETGTLFWINSLYSYAVTAVALIILLVGCFKKPDIYRGQNYAMLLGAGVALGINVFVILGFLNDFGDVSIISFAFAAICHYWALFLYKPVSMITLARSLAVNDIKNPVIIFNNDNVIIDANITANKLFGDYKQELSNISGGEFTHNGLIFEVNEKKLYDKRNIYIGRAIVLNDITKLKTVVDKLEFSIRHDLLTGLLTRDAFKIQLKTVSKDINMPIALIYVNICGMKILNNAFGYEFGDMVIQTVSEIISSELPSESIYARMNGDEFAMAFKNMDLETAKVLAKNVNKKCQEVKYKDTFIGLYIGVSGILSVSENFEISLKNAIAATYRAKLISSRNYYMEIFKSFEETLKKKNYGSEGHIERTTDICVKFSQFLGLSTDDTKYLCMLALTHDIGLLSSIELDMRRKGNMNNDEWNEFKLHPVRGYNLALAAVELSGIANDILAHHERYDGYGYPNRLKGDDIPCLARIIAIVDFFDDITFPSDGVAKNKNEALAELEKRAGTIFDPILASKFVEMMSADINIT